MQCRCRLNRAEMRQRLKGVTLQLQSGSGISHGGVGNQCHRAAIGPGIMGRVRKIMSIRRFQSIGGIMMFVWLASTSLYAGTKAPSSAIRLEADQSLSLRFFGSPDAELFTKELDASFQGVLAILSPLPVMVFLQDSSTHRFRVSRGRERCGPETVVLLCANSSCVDI